MINPKITSKEAAKVLGISARMVNNLLIQNNLPFYKEKGAVYFGYTTAAKLFNFKKVSKAIAFQIVKGGTGKTSVAFSFAVRANLYGYKVLCIDLDQQGNLTNCFGVNADNVPIMVDILAENYSFDEACVKVYPGLDLLSSRIENALLDDVIKLKKFDLDEVYRIPFMVLKESYDLIVIDCPPNVGQSVTACALGADMVVAPVIPENFALSGLKTTANTMNELSESYGRDLALKIVVNKFDNKALLSNETLVALKDHDRYSDKLLNSVIHSSADFPNSVSFGQSIYDNLKSSSSKDDIDALTRELLGITIKQKTMFKTLQSKLNLVEETIS